MAGAARIQEMFSDAIKALESRRHDDVLVMTGRLLKLAPVHVGGLYLRAHALMELPGHERDAEAAWRKLLQLTDRPEVVAVAANNLGTLLRNQGKLAEAEVEYQRALAADAANRVATRNLAALREDMQRRTLVKDDATEVQEWFARGLRALDAAKSSEILEAAEQVLQRDPSHLGANYLRAHALMEVPGRDAEAIDSWEAILARGSDAAMLAVASSNIGTIYRTQRQFALSEEYYQRALAVDPNNPVTYNNLGVLYRETQRAQQAEQAYRRALELRSDYPEALGNLGALLSDENRHHEAIDVCQRGLALAPDSLLANFNLGCALNKVGRSKDAIESYKRALKVNPAHLESLTNLLFALNFVAEAPPSETLEYARWYGRIATEHAKPYQHWRVANPPARLRIGLVSGDMLDHPVGFFLEQVVAHLDAERFELYGYMTCDRASPLTERIRPRFAQWRVVQFASDEELSRQIWEDGIHILIDLAGHTAFNRVAMFSHRPAPVQAAWLGYFATTGVTEIEYLIADPHSVPVEHESHFTETIWRLPQTRLCFTPPGGAPPVRVAPLAANGFVTFGCFQDLTKITEAVLAAWSVILARVPTARLRLQTGRLANSEVREGFLARMRAAGIDTARVDAHAGVSRAAYLDSYKTVDLLIDTFPFPGGTTTAEALFMGVPTVTIVGDRLISRQGAGMLECAGLTDWIAHDVSEYIDIAVARAEDGAGLAVLRADLRARALASPLFDGARFAEQLGAAFEGMWAAYCERAARPSGELAAG